MPLLAAGPLLGQNVAQLEANKKVAVEFFRPGITPAERIALMDDGYIQHNPAFKKFADENKLSYKEGARQMFGRGGGTRSGSGTERSAAPSG